MKHFLISIIIPTRNRQIYCEQAIRHIYSLSTEIQIVVNDNSDERYLEKQINDLIDGERLIYHFFKERISAVDNYDIAASFATGEFFCAIGDDDTVLSTIIDCAYWMKKNKIDAVKPFKKNCYWWPDKERDRGDIKKEGIVTCPPLSCNVSLYNPYESVIQLLKTGGQGYLSLHMVGSYHGLVRKKCMDKVKAITGHYYGGCSPDIYSATCLSLLPGIKFVEIGMPITLPGVCPLSTSADSVKGKHVGKLESAPQFIGMKMPYVWDKRIPQYYSVETIWAECFLKALTAMKKDELIEKYFNYKALYTAMYENNPNQKEEILLLLGDKIKDINSKRKALKTTKGRVLDYGNRIKRTILRQKLKLTPCNSIAIAALKTEQFLKRYDNRNKWKKILTTSV